MHTNVNTNKLYRASLPRQTESDIPIPLGQHIRTLDRLYKALTDNRIFSVLSGAPGVGKTTLIHALLKRLDESVCVGIISGHCDGFGELLNDIMMTFGLECLKRDNVILYERFTAFIHSCHEENRRVLLIVEDAHLLSNDILEQLRILSDINTSRRIIIQILLVGRDSLQETLYSQQLVLLAHRIEAHIKLPSFNTRETYIYVQDRIRNISHISKLFDHRACEHIHTRSQGVARSINRICDAILRYGSTRQIQGIDRNTITTACLNHSFCQGFPRQDDNPIDPAYERPLNTEGSHIEHNKKARSFPFPASPDELSLVRRLAADARARKERKKRIQKLATSLGLLTLVASLAAGLSSYW